MIRTIVVERKQRDSNKNHTEQVWDDTKIIQKLGMIG